MLHGLMVLCWWVWLLHSDSQLQSCILDECLHKWWHLVVAQVEECTTYHSYDESLVALYLLLEFPALVVLGAHPCNELEGFVCHDEGAGVVCAEVIHSLGEDEFPKLRADELHGLQLRLEFHLHIPDEQIYDLLSKTVTHMLNILDGFG